MTEMVGDATISEQIVCLPALHLTVRWWINGEPQPPAGIGFRGYVLSDDKQACLEVTSVPECGCPPAEPNDPE